MARSTRTPAAPTKKPARKKRSKSLPAAPSRSAAPFTMIPVLFLLSVGAILFGANCRQEGSIGTPDKTIASIIAPRNGGANTTRQDAAPPGPNRPLPPAPRSTAGQQMLLGNPDSATGDVSNREHFLLIRPQYALSYNESWHFPNWAAWHLSTQDIGNTERGQFTPDPDLPGSFTKIFTSDYNKSGYDRGHNCPSKDRSASRADNDATFFMTNITPQRHEMNAGPWEDLESHCRDLARQGNELYIIAGHGFKNKKIRYISPKRIAVPDFAWKIVVVLPDQEGDDRKRINRNTRVIAIQIPNVKGISKQKWTKYIVTVNDIEQATGLHFFDVLSSDTVQALRAKQDTGE